MPFVIKDYWTFVVVYACHVILAVFISQMYLAIDSYMFGAIYAAGGQIELLSLSIMGIENNLAITGERYNSKDTILYYIREKKTSH